MIGFTLHVSWLVADSSATRSRCGCCSDAYFKDEHVRSVWWCSCVRVCACVQHGVEWVQYLTCFLLSVNGDLDHVCGCVFEAFYARKFAVS